MLKRGPPPGPNETEMSAYLAYLPSAGPPQQPRRGRPRLPTPRLEYAKILRSDARGDEKWAGRWAARDGRRHEMPADGVGAARSMLEAATL